MQIPVFDPRSASCKAPYGAVPCGTEITLTLRPSAAEGFVACSLVLFQEFADRRREIPLTLSRAEGDRTVFTGSYAAPDEPELIWYAFRLTRQNGEEVWLNKDGVYWQQTVYDDSLPTPGWFGRGVTYQIFPDRFRRTGIPDPAGMVGKRLVHTSWDEPVELPENQGDNPNRDFYGGTLAGITEKLDYLQSLHITTLYLCPIFESASNHRYNTGDYEKIDPMLGAEEDFSCLCAEAKRRGIRVMLDGVFNHSGSNSRYFNADGFYSTVGAAQSQESSYFPWYTFRSWPDEYEAWWGVRTLPAVNEMHPDYMDFIIEGENSVIRRWLRAGVDAWRLDVADELPDEFIARIRRVMTEEKPDSFLLGEVWEDGSNKIAYDRRRRYLLGRETHGLMNYPFRVAALSYLLGYDIMDSPQPYYAEYFREAMETIRENYPRPAFYSAMNMFSTHDTPRVLTMLGGPWETPESREDRFSYRLTPEERERGIALLKAGAVLLYAFPGSPTIFYGDEAGMEGYEDPMNRGTFPWGREDRELQSWFAKLGALRENRASLQTGELRWLYAKDWVLAFARDLEGETTAAVINAGSEPVVLSLPCSAAVVDAMSGQEYFPCDGELRLTVRPRTGMLLI